LNARVLAEAVFDFRWFRHKADAFVGKEPVIGPPGLKKVQRPAIHGGGRRKETQHAYLCKARKSDGRVGRSPPEPGSFAVNVILKQQCHPDVDIREIQ